VHLPLPFKAVVLSTSVAAIISGQTFAQQAEPEIEETVIWGTQVSSSSLFLGESDIAIKQVDHLSDLLRDIPGVDIGGTHSVNARINFRGLDDRDLAVFIDNALQTNYLYHHMGNLLVNADILKQAEIDLGANSVVHGGLGGSIRFETKDAAELLAASGRSSDTNIGARFMMGYQSNAQTSASVTAYGQAGRFDLVGYFHEVDRDNFEDGDGTETLGSDGTTKNFMAKLGAQLSDDQRLELSVEKIEDAGDYTQRPDLGLAANESITGSLVLPTEYERETINLGYELDRGPLFNARVTLYSNDMYLWRDERETFTRSGPGTIKDGEADNEGLNIFATSQFAQHSLTYGVDFYEQNLIYRGDLVAGTAPVKETGRSTAIFIEDAIDFGPLTLTPGVRWSKFEKDVQTTGSSGSWDEFSFALAGDYQIIDGLNLLASYTELFKGPELAELFVGGAEEKIINPNVKPETGDNIQLGLRYTTSVGQAVVNFGFNLFETRIEDYVNEDDVPGESGLIWDTNVGTATIEGGEASLNVSFDAAQVLLTYAKSELDASELELENPGDSLREIGDSMSFELRATPLQSLDIVYGIRHTFSVDTITDTTKDSYTLHNVSVGWTPMDALSINAGVENLLDETYTSHASRVGEAVHPRFGALLLDDLEPGRNMKLSIAYTF
jgi:hemoglobin/transferrin/lactoferrin receptor protein